MTTQTPEDYAARKEARIERMRARAAAKAAEADSLQDTNRRLGQIMAGTPVIVGHHSEKRHRRDLDRMQRRDDKAMQLAEDAKRLERRAANAEANRTIDSDDPEALDKLRAKLADVNEQHAAFKAALKPKLTREQISRGEGPAAVERALLAIGVSAVEADWIRQVGGGYKLRNLRAEAKRLEGRIVELEAQAARGPVEPERFGDVEIREEDNRVRIIFPGKPGAEIRTALKANGFRWSPSAGAWQRKPGIPAWRDARAIARKAVA